MRLTPRIQPLGTERSVEKASHIHRSPARRGSKGATLFYMYEFEVFEDDGWFLAVPFDMLGGTQGETFDEC